ncbi:MAG: hypothetical protein ABUS54_13575 [Actinomycetota bacterium]
MRAALAAGSIGLLLAGGAAARVGSAPSPLGDLHVVQVDLAAAERYESLAQQATDAFKRRQALQHAEAAVNASLGAVKALTPPTELIAAAQAFGVKNDVAGVSDAVKRLLAHLSATKPVPHHFLVDALNAAATETRNAVCTSLTDFRGAVMVNGVAVTPPTLTWRISCPYTIRGADFEIPGHTWSAVDTGGGQTAMLDGGRVLQAAGDGSTSLTLTTEDEAGVQPGEEGEVVIIHGDSATYFQETM